MFEYKREIIDWHKPKGLDTLNDLGAIGWEVVSITPHQVVWGENSKFNLGDYFLFKRKIGEYVHPNLRRTED